MKLPSVGYSETFQFVCCDAKWTNASEQRIPQKKLAGMTESDVEDDSDIDADYLPPPDELDLDEDSD